MQSMFASQEDLEAAMKARTPEFVLEAVRSRLPVIFPELTPGPVLDELATFISAPGRPTVDQNEVTRILCEQLNKAGVERAEDGVEKLQSMGAAINVALYWMGTMILEPNSHEQILWDVNDHTDDDEQAFLDQVASGQIMGAIKGEDGKFHDLKDLVSGKGEIKH